MDEPGIVRHSSQSFEEVSQVSGDHDTVSSTTIVVSEVETISYLPARHSSFSLSEILLGRIRSVAAVLVFSIFILTFILQPFRIPSESMERTLLVGDFLLVNKAIFAPAGPWGWLLPYRNPRRGDIVVFRFPLDGEEHIVKRVIGVGGDHIHLLNGVVYRNGEALIEPYTRQSPGWKRARAGDSFRDDFPVARYTDPGVDPHWWALLQTVTSRGDVVVPPHEYFVMGDNRNFSRDSRYWGFVPRTNIVGTPMLIYFSVLEPSRTDPYLVPPPAQDDRLGNSTVGRFLRFARWDRFLRIVH